ncbi:MAG: glycosyltransferase family 39 protein [Anaerolineales bacterium]|nr:glycosyltransferase family 39 protein [Anaerolineales bacterium]
MNNKTFQTSTYYTAVVLVVAAFYSLAWPFLLKAWNSASDEGAFLLLGLDIQAGVRMTDGMRHMLLPLTLSTFASTDWVYFSTAKIMNMGFATVVLLLILFLTRRSFNPTVALMVMTLVAFNRGYWKTMTRVISEPLLLIFIVLAYYFWYTGARKDSTRHFWLMGAMIGLAYLTKGTAQLLLICFLGWVVLTGYWRRWRMLVGVLAAYLLAASPLLIYNTITWGTPFYNYNSSHAFWYDDWNDSYIAPDKNLSTFLATHTIGDIVNRFISGMTYLFNSQGEVISPAIVLLLLVAAGALYLFTWIKSPDRAPLAVFKTMDARLRNNLLIPVVVIPIWLIFFAWFAPVSNFPRHVIPVVPLISVVVSLIFYRAIMNLPLKPIQTYFPSIVNVTIITVSMIGIIVGYRTLAAEFPVWNVYEVDQIENQSLDELLHGLEGLKPGVVTVVSGPSHTIPAWRARSTSLIVKEIPITCKSIDCLSDFLHENQADYLVIDAQMVQHLPFLTDYFQVTRQEDFEMIQEFPLMTLMANYKLDHGRRILIFESTPNP